MFDLESVIFNFTVPLTFDLPDYYVSGSKCVLYERKTGNSLFTISILARRRREKIVYWVFSTGNPGKS